jgi:hypothetical protein
MQADVCGLYRCHGHSEVHIPSSNGRSHLTEISESHTLLGPRCKSTTSPEKTEASGLGACILRRETKCHFQRTKRRFKFRQMINLVLSRPTKSCRRPGIHCGDRAVQERSVEAGMMAYLLHASTNLILVGVAKMLQACCHRSQSPHYSRSKSRQCNRDVMGHVASVSANAAPQSGVSASHSI